MDTCKKEYILSFNVLKFICALLVLYIHVPFSTDLYLYQMPTRIAVPMFFVISGFFWQTGRFFLRTARLFTRYLFWFVITVFYELGKGGGTKVLEIVETYVKAFPSAGEYMIGVLWFIITLFWCSLIVGVCCRLGIVEWAALVYAVCLALQLSGELTILPNSTLVPFMSIFVYMKYIFIGVLIGKHKDFFVQRRFVPLWHSLGVFGITGFVYKGISYAAVMAATDAPVTGFVSYYMDFIILWLFLFALYHPLSRMNRKVADYLGVVSSLLFFSQRIVIDLTRLCWGNLFTVGCTWGRLYAVVLCIICIIGLGVMYVQRNRFVKNGLRWII